MTKNLVTAIGSGIIAGVTIGIVVRFATDGKTLKYAAIGGIAGGIVAGIINVAKKVSN